MLSNVRVVGNSVIANVLLGINTTGMKHTAKSVASKIVGTTRRGTPIQQMPRLFAITLCVCTVKMAERPDAMD